MKNAVRRLLLRWLYGKRALRSPAPGLVVLDSTGHAFLRELDRHDPDNDAVSVADDIEQSPAHPKWRYIVGPNAVDTLSRTPAEILFRVAYVRDLRIIVAHYKPGTDPEIFTRLGYPVVRLSAIITMLSGSYDPALKRVYARVEEDMIRTILENGHTPVVMRYSGSRKTRERFVRIAREYVGVQVVAAVLSDEPDGKRLSLFERRMLSGWSKPTREEGFNNVVDVRELRIQGG